MAAGPRCAPRPRKGEGGEVEGGQCWPCREGWLRFGKSVKALTTDNDDRLHAHVKIHLSFISPVSMQQRISGFGRSILHPTPQGGVLPPTWTFSRGTHLQHEGTMTFCPCVFLLHPSVVPDHLVFCGVVFNRCPGWDHLLVKGLRAPLGRFTPRAFSTPTR